MVFAAYAHRWRFAFSFVCAYVRGCVYVCVCVCAYVWAGGGPCRTPSLIHLTFPVLKILIAARHPLTCIYDKAPTKPSCVSRFLCTAQDSCRRLCPALPSPVLHTVLLFCSACCLEAQLQSGHALRREIRSPERGPWAPGANKFDSLAGRRTLGPESQSETSVGRLCSPT